MLTSWVARLERKSITMLLSIWEIRRQMGGLRMDTIRKEHHLMTYFLKTIDSST